MEKINLSEMIVVSCDSNSVLLKKPDHTVLLIGKVFTNWEFRKKSQNLLWATLRFKEKDVTRTRATAYNPLPHIKQEN